MAVVIESFNDYQNRMKEFAKYPTGDLAYVGLGLTGEAGEVANKLKKIIRDKSGVMTAQDRLDIARELGDTLWYVAALTWELGLQLQDVAQMNYEKLMSRKERGVLKGDGDNR